MQNDLVLSSIPISELKEDLRSIITETIQTELTRLHESNTAKDSKLLTRDDAAKFIGISLPTLNEWTKQGLIPGYRIGSRVRYKREELEQSLLAIRTLKRKEGGI